jgi:two-component system, OmpR family, sensor histidine kinase CiaH
MSVLWKKYRNIKFTNFVYWALFIYVVAALVWWFVSLEIQNKERLVYETESLQTQKLNNPVAYTYAIDTINGAYNRRKAKHISEGLTFLVVIIIGAFFVYRAIKKQLNLNRQQQNFIMAVTHELKTPIAISKLNIETLQKRQLEEVQKQKLLQNTLKEMHRLNDLATNILVISQIESKNYRLKKEQINLSDIVNNLVIDMQSQFANRLIENKIANNIYINGDALMLKLVVSNLIDNAIKYSPKNEPILVELSANKLYVKDFGTGILEEDKKNVFQKFYRAGNEITRTSKGTGLGLYLCKKILNDHNATIEITNNTPNGSIFVITFKI